MTDRRQFLKGAAGALGLWAVPRLLAAQTAVPLQRLNDKVSILKAGDANLLFMNSGVETVLVDGGASAFGPGIKAALGPAVQVLFNTHHHLDQTGNNAMFAAAGAKIIAHERTRQWMSTDYWIPAEDRFEPARPKAARPTETFQDTGSLSIGGVAVEYGHLPLAHTNGDIYVHFKTLNVLAVGDVASPVRDPELDYFTGAWIGGRVDAMDIILKLANGQTKIVPSYGPVMTRDEFKAERDMMEEVRVRLFDQIREGKGPKQMLEAGALNGLPRTWKDPHKFLYDAAKGLWGHHSKIDHNVV